MVAQRHGVDLVRRHVDVFTSPRFIQVAMAGSPQLAASGVGWISDGCWRRVGARRQRHLDSGADSNLVVASHGQLCRPACRDRNCLTLHALVTGGAPSELTSWAGCPISRPRWARVDQFSMPTVWPTRRPATACPAHAPSDRAILSPRCQRGADVCVDEKLSLKGACGSEPP